MKVTLNGKQLNGIKGTGIGCATLLLIGSIFLFIGFIFLLPIIVPIIIGVFIGRWL